MKALSWPNPDAREASLQEGEDGSVAMMKRAGVDRGWEGHWL